jgi:hypothetical protein
LSETVGFRVARRRKKTTTVAHVRWFDAAIQTGLPCPPGEVTGVLENESAGLLLRETDRLITLALDRCLDTGEVRLILTIPRENVRSVRRFVAEAD